MLQACSRSSLQRMESMVEQEVCGDATCGALILSSVLLKNGPHGYRAVLEQSLVSCSLWETQAGSVQEG